MPFQRPKWAVTPARVNRFATLEVEKDGHVVETLAIGGQACFVLGRNEDVCDFGVAHPSVSRQHAALVHADGARVRVMDLGSAQGTFVNDKELEPHTPVDLNENDVIRFGASTRLYHVRKLGSGVERETTATPMDEEMLRDMPQSFGDQEKKKDLNEDDLTTKKSTAQLNRQKREAEIAAMTAEMLAAPQPSHVEEVAATSEKPLVEDNEDVQSSSESEDSDAEGGAKDDTAARYKIPLSHEVIFPGHVNSVSCIAVDAPGARFATGSIDYHVKLWDFAGMARQVRPFRDVEVDDGHPVVALSYSPSGDRLLVATASSQPKVLSREGVEELQFAKGDMYVMDMSNTNGHTHAVTGGAWHPTVRDQMITSSLDGTIRIWHLGGKQTFKKLINTSVLKLKSRKGKRCGVTTCRYNLDGSFIAGGTMDGQVQCWDPRKAYAGPAITIRDAHADGDGDLGVSCVRFSPDGRLVASRACSDDTVKLWDVRKPKQCLKTFTGVTGVLGSCNVAFNASGTCLAAGTCVPKGKNQRGQVLLLDVASPGVVAPVSAIDMAVDESAICVEWHYGLNQLFVGSSLSRCRVFYDQEMSAKGVLLTATKQLKVAPSDSGLRLDGVGQVHNPHALPMYRSEESKKRKFHKIRKDAKASHAPERPITGVGVGGKISGSTTFTQYFMSSHIKTSFRDEDPREAILKYAKKAQEDPQFMGPAYSRSQPTGQIDKRYQLAKQTLEQEKIAKEEEDRRLLQP